MALVPLFQLDSSEDLLSPSDRHSTIDGSPQRAKGQTTAVAVESASTLAAHGGEADAADLTLELLLNEVVRQARLATGATGAAIALLRGEEMVCRAGSGADVPDPGERLDTRSGLSGMCIRARELQQCNDTETDPRVDPDACRRLGVRSILVMPLTDGDELFGVVVMVSPRPNAFEQRDVETLRTLTHRILDNRRQAKDAVATPPREESGSVSHHASSDQTVEAVSPDRNNALESVPKHPSRQRSSRSYDLWTIVLSVCVLGTAVLLGTLIGWRFGRQQAILGFRGNSHRANPASRTVSVPRTPRLASKQQPSSASAVDSSQAAGAESASKPLALGATRSPAPPPPGGLVVSQNGQVIFRMPASAPSPAATAEGSESPQLSQADLPSAAVQAVATGSVQPVPEEFATARLIHRVEPEYPSGAREQHIQGPVVLEAQIGTDGSIQNITVSEGNPILSPAAVAAVKQWKYQPYSVAGRPVQMQARITINFILPAN